MKRIVYNSKLKKIVVAFVIFIMIINYIFPNTVIASKAVAYVNLVDGVPQATGSIQEIVTSMQNVGENKIGSPQTIKDRVGGSTTKKDLENLEDTVKADIKTWIDSNYSDIKDTIKDISDFKNKSVEEKRELYLDKIYRDYSQDSSKIKVTCHIEEFPGSMEGWKIEKFTSEINLSREEVEVTLKKSNSEIGNIDESLGRVNEDAVTDDIGGILLSPVFYLINFIADAITGNLGFIMDESGLVTGIGVLRNATTPPEEGKNYYDYPVDTSWNAIGGIQYPNITYTPEEIFAGKIELLSIDFISGKDYNGNEITGDWSKIRNVISSWYKVLRMIAIIGLLSVLIYTGIKIMISANAKDKAKFKEWIINWFMAVAILFFMHYIMAFIISVTGELSKLVSNASQGIKIINGSEESVTNLMGLVRFMVQSEDFYMKVGYEVMYIALIVYTIKFTIVYLKRVLSMAFLTLIAPIVALTYPIDKINDGQAQGFNMWLKEYIFNALLQPMHCIMYYILVGSAVGIAAENPIYGIVVLAFMTEAEKLLKKIFGFDKAGGGTVGGMAGAFAAGALASNVKNIARLASGGKGGKGSSGEEKDILESPKPTNRPGMDEVFSDDQGSSGPDNNTEDGGNGTGADNGGNGTGADNGGNGTGTHNRGNGRSAGENNNQEKTTQQKMLDAYDDNYNSDEWNAQDRDAMAREVYKDDGGRQYSEDEYRQILMDSGYEGEELEQAMREGGYGPSYDQVMLDAYDDNYNSDEWNAQDRDAMAREAYIDDGGRQYSEDEYRQILMDSGYEGEELEQAMIDGGYGPSNEQDSEEGQEAGQDSEEGQEDGQNLGNGSNNDSNSDNRTDNGESIREKAKKAMVTVGKKLEKPGKGMLAVGKRLSKPVWDFDKSKSYNFKRLLKTGGRAVVGATLGTAAAAVQAGISITDGKYNPMEGMATFAAGYAGGGVLARGMGSLVDTYREGSLPEDKEARNKEIMKRAKAKFADRDDVIAFNKRNFAGREKEVVQRQRDNYLETGITDLKEMKSGIKYADTIVGNIDGLDAEQIKEKRRNADRKAAATINFRKTLQEQGQLKSVYDADKQNKYIQSMVDKAEDEDKEKVRKQYENAFKAVAEYDAANA